MTTTTAPLTEFDVLSYATVIKGCRDTAKVRILLEDGKILEGILRYLDGDQGTPRPADVRDAYVRVTSVSGFEHWFRFVELAEKSAHGELAIEKG